MKRLTSKPKGETYGNGRGVTQDYPQAYKWVNLSASRSQGKIHEDSVRDQNLIENILTPAQVAKAQKLSREWKPKTWRELSLQN